MLLAAGQMATGSMRPRRSNDGAEIPFEDPLLGIALVAAEDLVPAVAGEHDSNPASLAALAQK